MVIDVKLFLGEEGGLVANRLEEHLHKNQCRNLWQFWSCEVLLVCSWVRQTQRSSITC